jgi:hypothetical protein
MKNKLFVVLAVIAGVVLLAGCMSDPTVAESRHQNWGTFGEAARIPVKDFVTLGFVFTKAVFTVGDRAVITGDVFTYQALLKEAELKGADAIINVVVDKRSENILVGSGVSATTIKQETWYGSALAIKYTHAILPDKQDTLTTNEPHRYVISGGHLQ